VRDPGRNVDRASVIGTVASAIVYLLVSAAVTGLVPHHALVGNGAPFVNAFEAIFSHGAWATISGIGALNGWTLVTTEASKRQPMMTSSHAPSPGPTATTTRGSA